MSFFNQKKSILNGGEQQITTARSSTSITSLTSLLSDASQQLDQQQEKILSCSICKNQMEISNDSNKLPKVLPCLHTFCSSCLTDLKTKGNGNIKCMICETINEVSSVDELPNNYEVMKSIKLLSIYSAVHYCESCLSQTLAEYKCIDCESTFCESHRFRHSEVKRNHQLISLEDEHSNENSVNFIPKCTISGHQTMGLDYYCENCEKLVCSSCGLTNHSQLGHNVLTVLQSVNKNRKPIEELSKSIEPKVLNFEDSLTQINQILEEIEINHKKTENEIKNESEMMRNAINEREKRLLCQLNEITKGKQNNLQNQLKNIENQSKSIKFTFDFTRRTLDMLSETEEENDNNNNNNSNNSNTNYQNQNQNQNQNRHQVGNLMFLSLKNQISKEIERNCKFNWK